MDQTSLKTPFTAAFPSAGGALDPPPASLGVAASIGAEEEPTSSLPRVAAAFSGGGAKYFVSGVVGGRGIDSFVDSGADLSVVPPEDVQHLSKQRLDRPFVVNGFTGGSKAEITHFVDATLDFCPGKVSGRFYVVDTPVAILGSDLLRDPQLRLSLETGEDILRIGSDVIFTKRTAADARGELRRRRRNGSCSYRQESRHLQSKTAWLRSSRRVILPPKSLTVVSAVLESATPISKVHSVFSLFDAGSSSNDGDIFIPSMSFDTAFLSKTGVIRS